MRKNLDSYCMILTAQSATVRIGNGIRNTKMRTAVIQMRSEYVLVFECCGNEVSLGYDDAVGAHGDYCLACDTDNPDTRRERRVTQ